MNGLGLGKPSLEDCTCPPPWNNDRSPNPSCPEHGDLCRHCGAAPDGDGDHSCPCPLPDEKCAASGHEQHEADKPVANDSEYERAIRAEVKAAVEEWFTDVSLDDMYAVKGWAVLDPDQTGDKP